MAPCRSSRARAGEVDLLARALLELNRIVGRVSFVKVPAVRKRRCHRHRCYQATVSMLPEAVRQARLVNQATSPLRSPAPHAVKAQAVGAPRAEARERVARQRTSRVGASHACEDSMTPCP